MLKFDKFELPEMDAQDVRNEYIHYEANSSEWRYQIAEDEEFYLGKQLTQAQKDYLLSVGQPAEANNKIRPAVETVLSNIAAAQPEWDVEPIGKMDNRLAAVYNQLMDMVWNDSNGNVQFRECCKDFIVKGIAYMYIYPDYQADAGDGAIRIKRFNPESVFVDPNTSLSNFADAASIIYSDLHTKESLKVLFPEFADEIDDAQEDYDRNEISSGKYDRDAMFTRADVSYDDEARAKVRKFIRFSKVSIPKAKLTEGISGKVTYFDEEGYKEVSKDKRFQELLEQGNITEELVYETRVREQCVIGDKLYYDEIHPISDYPLVVACNEHNGTPYPVGDVRHAKSPQRMLNRTEALLIAHTNATTNFKLVVEDGAIDPKELQKWNIPNAVVRANPGALREGKIKEFVPPAVSSSLYTEKQRYELDIEQVFGAYKYMQGYAGGSPGTVGEAQIVDEAASRKQNWKVMPIYEMLTLAGRLCTQWIPFVYNQQRVMRIVNDFGSREEVQVNEVFIDDKTGELVKMYDLVTTRADIRVIIGSTRAKSPMADLQKDLQLMSAGIYDKTQVIMNMKTDVDKQGLIQRHSEIAELMQQLRAAQEQVKELSGDLQTRERELFHSRMKAEVAEATKKVSDTVTNVKASARIENAKQREETRKVSEQNSQAAQQAVNSNQAPSPQEGQAEEGQPSPQQPSPPIGLG